MTESAVTLPGGFWSGRRFCREARVRALTGADEEYLAETQAMHSVAERCTALLARSVTRLGATAPNEAGVRNLSLGDREALLLSIRRITLGDRIETTAVCPALGCAQVFDITLEIGSLLIPPYGARKRWRDAAVESGRQRHRFVVRPVNGADQEQAARLAPESIDSAVALVLRRCTRRRGPAPRRATPDNLQPQLSRLLAALDPQAQITLQLRCPECAHSFALLFDAGTFLLGELDARNRDLHRHVHLLAFHYGWREADILALTAPRRERYIRLLTDQLAGGAV